MMKLYRNFLMAGFVSLGLAACGDGTAVKDVASTDDVKVTAAHYTVADIAHTISVAAAPGIASVMLPEPSRFARTEERTGLSPPLTSAEVLSAHRAGLSTNYTVDIAPLGAFSNTRRLATSNEAFNPGRTPRPIA